MTPEEICDLYHDLVDLVVGRVRGAKSSWRRSIDAKGYISLHVARDTATLSWVNNDYENAYEDQTSFPAFIVTMNDAEFDAADKKNAAIEEAEKKRKSAAESKNEALAKQGEEWEIFQALQRKFADGGRPSVEAIAAYQEKKRKEDERNQKFLTTVQQVDDAFRELMETRIKTV